MNRELEPGQEPEEIALDRLDEGEPGWGRALLGFAVLFCLVGLFYLFWIVLFALSGAPH